MQNPFDDDYNIINPPDIDDGTGTYKNFPSAEGYEKVPDNWKPRAGRELPALRCTHVDDETDARCRKFGIRGTGFNGTPAMCMYHGGSLPSVKNKAEATLLSVRMMMVQNAPKAFEILFDLAQNSSADAIKLKAAESILDRAGIKGGFEVNVEVNHNVSAADEIRKKLTMMGDRIKSAPEPALTDMGEVAEPEES